MPNKLLLNIIVFVIIVYTGINLKTTYSQINYYRNSSKKYEEKIMILKNKINNVKLAMTVKGSREKDKDFVNVFLSDAHRKMETLSLIMNNFSFQKDKNVYLLCFDFMGNYLDVLSFIEFIEEQPVKVANIELKGVSDQPHTISAILELTW